MGAQDDRKQPITGMIPSLPFGVFYHPLMHPSLAVSLSASPSHTGSNDSASSSSNAPPSSPVSSISKKLKPTTGTCIITGQVRPLTDLVRCVVAPDKTIMIDLDEKLPGEFMWMTASKDVFKKAIWRNSFTTILRDSVITPKDLADKTELGLLKKSLETLGLAKKAGILITGFAKCEEWLHSDPATVYCVASDASDHGRKKLQKSHVATINCFTNAQLSAALGDVNIMHVALKPHAITTKLQNLVHKLALMRGDIEPQDMED
jgi:predicted RNA-binding protein YlxR (DUF448 family)